MFFLFAWDGPYPGGGAADFQGEYDTVAEAREHRPNSDQAHVAALFGGKLRIVSRWDGKRWQECDARTHAYPRD